MDVDEKLIKHVSKVSRLELTKEEIKEFLPQLKEVLNTFSQIQKVDTKNTQLGTLLEQLVSISFAKTKITLTVGEEKVLVVLTVTLD